MKRIGSTARLALGIALSIVVPHAPIADARDKKPAPTIKDLGDKPVDVRPEAPVAAGSSRAMDNYRRFLELQSTDAELRAEALRRLGDLNLESGELERMEQEVTAVDLAGAEAIDLYTTLLKAYPNYPRNDQVLYQLARAYETTGQPDKALATLDDVVAKYPGTPQLDEVQFRRGEILFSGKNYAAAEAAYASVIATGDRSAFYEQSLYKHGWSLFKQSQNEPSLESFGKVLDATLLDRGRGGAVTPLDELSRAERELAEDTLRVMAITFSYLDGTESLDRYVDAQDSPAYSYLLYSRLGDLYVDKERFQDAAGTYRAFATRDPDNDQAPALSVQAIEAYKKGGFTDLVLEGKREFVERYGFAQSFWAGRDRAAYGAVVAELKTNLKDVAQYYHAAAQGSKKVEDYQQAARWYRDYLASFPDEPDSAGTNYLLAETLFESRQFLEAANEYERTAYTYPIDKQSAAAGYAALVAYQREEEALTGQAKAELHKRAVDSGVRFAQAFPEHPDSAGVLTRAAQDIFAAGELPRAIQVAQLLLARQPPVDVARQRIAWTIIGQSQFDLGLYDKAEAAYVNARTLTAPDDPLRADLTERLAASVYRQAEAKRSAGDADGAVDAFLRVAAVAPDSKIRSTATYDAAAQLVTMQAWDRAIPVLESFRRDFPQDELAPEVTRNLAVAYSQTGRAGEAAAEFERIAGSATEDPAIRREATLQAADLYEKAANPARTAAMLEKYVADFPTPVPEAIEARQRLVDLAAGRGDTTGVQKWQREIIATDRDAGAARTDRTRYLAARSQLALAAPARDTFKSLRLSAPLKKSLAPKRAALEAAMKAYRDAAEYRVAEVTTAATYEMADLYTVLARDLMESERPKSLRGEELEQYDLLLEEQAFPFEEQAIALHELNAARVKENLYDESMRKSFDALAKIEPARYGKTEAAAEPVVAFDATSSVSPSMGATPVSMTTVSASPPPPPARAIADFDRAVGLMRGGKLGEAELEFGQLTAAYPDYAGPFVNLGIATRAAGKLDESAAALRAAVERNPSSAPAATQLGLTLRMQGEFEASQAAYDQAIAADPAYAPAYRNRAVLLDMYRLDPEGALADFERYKALTEARPPAGDGNPGVGNPAAGEAQPAVDKALSGWLAELRQRTGKAAPQAPEPVQAESTDAAEEAAPSGPGATP